MWPHAAFALAGLSVLSLASAGAGQPVGPVPVATPPRAAGAEPAPRAGSAGPACSSGHVYVYLINGVDPLWVAGLKQLGDQIRQAGYPDTKVIGWHEAAAAEREIRCLHQTAPAGRFALIGYSAGTYAAKSMAGRLTRDGVPVALVGYVGGDYLRDSCATQLAGVGRVVNVTGDGYLLTGGNLFFNGTCVTGAQNVQLPGTRHFNLPRHPLTSAALIEGLNEASVK